MRVLFVCRNDEIIGVEYLSSALKAAGHTTMLVADTVTRPKSPTELTAEILAAEPDIVAFSVVSVDYQWALGIASAIKASSDLFTMFGGIHVTSVPDRVIRHECIDAICIGEGERALLELADQWDGGAIDEGLQIPNLWFKVNGHVIHDARPTLHQDLDSLPFPDKALFYDIFPSFEVRYRAITARGCPFSCTYCHNSVQKKLFGSRGYVRQRSPDNVLEELVGVGKKWHHEEVEFWDDTFIINKDWLQEFLPRYASLVELPFSCFAHVHLLDQDVVDMLKDARCRMVRIGVQTVNEKLRREVLRRPETNEQLAGAIARLKSAGIGIRADHIVGIPYQTEADLRNAVLFYARNRPSTIWAFKMGYFPKTPIVETAREAGLLGDEEIENIEEGRAAFHIDTPRGESFDTSDVPHYQAYKPLLEAIPNIPNFMTNWCVESYLQERSGLAYKLSKAIVSVAHRFMKVREFGLFRVLKQKVINIKEGQDIN